MKTEYRELGGERPIPEATGKRRHAGRLMAGAVIAFVGLVVAGVYAWRTGSRPEDLASLGYPGVFLMMALSGASIFLPAPGQAAILAAGALWSPVLVGIAAGLGNATGELTGYLAGRAGASVLSGRKAPRCWSGLRGMLRRHGFLAVLGLALIPNPAFDAIGLLAGSLAYPPIRRFWLACALGNSAKYVGVAYLGDLAGFWLA